MNSVQIKCKNCGCRLYINKERQELNYPVSLWAGEDDSHLFCYACTSRKWNRKCECGSEIAGILGHSEWCPKYEELAYSKDLPNNKKGDN